MRNRSACFVRALALVFAALTGAGLACTPQEKVETPPPFPPPARTVVYEGETCTPGATTPHCAPPLHCKEQPYTKPPASDKPRSPEEASDVGGGCGGVAGYHCAEGLDCVMPQDQIMVADGMGSCALHGVCKRDGS